MLSYLEKFNNLPKDLKDKISSPEIMENISAIEKEYELSLAVVIMRVMVKEISIVDLAKFFVFEHGMDGSRANKLVEDLKNGVFYDVFRYLDISESKLEVSEDEATAGKGLSKYFAKKKTAPVQSSNFFFSTDDEEEIKTLTQKLKDFGEVAKPKKEKKEMDNNPKIDAIIKEANLSFSSEDMNMRFRKMIDIYLKRVRNKVDTKQTMTKLISLGGLGVSTEVADKILRITDVVEDSFVQAAKDGEKKKEKKTEKSKEESILEEILKPKEENSYNLDEEEKLDKKEVKDDIEGKETLKKDKEQVLAESAIPEVHSKSGDNKKIETIESPKKGFDIMEEVGKVSGGDIEYDFNGLRKRKPKPVKEKKDDFKIIDERQEKLDLDKVEQEIESIDLDSIAEKLPEKSDFAKKQEGLLDEDEESEKNEKILPKDKLVIEAEQLEKNSEDNVKSEATEEEMVLDLSAGETKEKKDTNSNVSAEEKKQSSENSIQAGVKINRPTVGVHSMSAPGGKIKMEDVKYVPKLMGPIDELGEMNLVNFRRLSQDPKEATAKIEEKIKFLEQDRYAKRIEGIKAWRKSPINKLYLEIGQEGIIVARGIENAIKAREKSKKDFLTLAEFNSIMELNKRIRY